jgi:DNA-binding MarR family transcriptional regulator
MYAQDGCVVNFFSGTLRNVETEQERLGAWLNFLQAHAAVVDSLERKLESEKGLPLPWHEVLMRLASSPDGRLRMFDLSELLLLSKSGATRLVDRMEEAGLVSRGGCATDRRVTYAVITEKGRITLEDSMPVFQRGVEEFFSKHLTDEDVAALRGVLRKLLEGNGEWREHRCSPAHLTATTA